MWKFTQFVRPFIPIAVVILLCVTTAPAAQANNGNSTGPAQKTATTSNSQEQQDVKQPKVTAQKPSQKSVLDADMLERPLSFFKNSFSPEEDDDDEMFSHSSTVVMAVKALIASLLSTLI